MSAPASDISFVDLGDLRLEYRWIPPVAAGRPALVFLHEGLGCVAMWKGFPDRIAAATGCGALVYSRAGYGRSSPVAVPRPLRYMHDEGLDVLPRLLRALTLDRVVLIGHSDGGSIALVHGGSGRAPETAGIVTLAAHVFNEDLCVASIRAAKDAYVAGELCRRLERFHGDNVDCAFWGWNGAWLDPGFREWNLKNTCRRSGCRFWRSKAPTIHTAAPPNTRRSAPAAAAPSRSWCSIDAAIPPTWTSRKPRRWPSPDLLAP